MENERSILLELIERYRHLLRGVNDERVCRELEQLLREAEERLSEIDRRC